MKRRDFVKASLLTPAALSLDVPRIYAAGDEYLGRCLVTLQADGGWDTSSFCDPKVNLPGEREITAWSRADEPRQAGAIAYAPYGTNAAFFDKYHRDMLVINGVDVQTNAHSVGSLHSWTGRNAAGLPTLGALFAAVSGPDVPLAYLNFGGVAATERLVRFTRLNNPYQLEPALQPNSAGPPRGFVNPELLARIQSAQAMRAEARASSVRTMPLEAANARAYVDSLVSKAALDRMAAILPPLEDFPPYESPTDLAAGSSLRSDMMYAVLSFRAGVSAAADLFHTGFDTHQTHDEDHEPNLSFLTDAIDFFWTYAEQQGVADRITLVVGSDFGRTPWYNSTGGKDHWPIGSYLVMEKNAVWGNRVVGATDGGQNAHTIDPDSLQVVEDGGSLIHPKHVHQALRRYMGIDSSPVLDPFRFPNAEDFDFFNPGKVTAR